MNKRSVNRISIRCLENALKLEGLEVSDINLVDFAIDGGYSDERAQRVAGTQLFAGRRAGSRSAGLAGLLRAKWMRSFSRTPRPRWLRTSLACTR
jgi:hypothetical protein